MMRLILIALLMMPVLSSSPVLADRTDLTTAPPIRNARALRDARHEVKTVFGFSFKDAYRQNLSAGLTYRYYFNNWLGVGVDLMATYLSLETGLTEQIEAELSQVGKSKKPGSSSPSLLAGVGVTLVPIAGKFMVLGQIPVSYDVHFIAGAGFASTKGHEGIEDTVTWAPMVGVGARMFASDWIAVELGFRDYIIKMPLVAPADTTAPAVTYEQNLMVTIGVSFFFPPEIEQEL